MADIIKISNEDAFDKVINNAKKPVLVDFWATWCGPCKAIAPILEELSRELGESVQIVKVDVDQNAELAGRFGIHSIPTLLLFKDGQVVETVVGLTSKDALKKKITAAA